MHHSGLLPVLKKVYLSIHLSIHLFLRTIYILYTCVAVHRSGLLPVLKEVYIYINFYLYLYLYLNLYLYASRCTTPACYPSTNRYIYLSIYLLIYFCIICLKISTVHTRTPTENNTPDTIYIHRGASLRPAARSKRGMHTSIYLSIYIHTYI